MCGYEVPHGTCMTRDHAFRHTLTHTDRSAMLNWSQQALVLRLSVINCSKRDKHVEVTHLG